MTPVTRRPTATDHVKIGMAHMVHRRHPRLSWQTECEAVQYLVEDGKKFPYITHAGLTPTIEQVTCPRCLHSGSGRAA